MKGAAPDVKRHLAFSRNTPIDVFKLISCPDLCKGKTNAAEVRDQIGKMTELEYLEYLNTLDFSSTIPVSEADRIADKKEQIEINRINREEGQ